jgi:hypothetical protein
VQGEVMKIYVVIAHCIEEDYTDGYFLHKEDAAKQLVATIEKEKDVLRDRNKRTKELDDLLGCTKNRTRLINIDKATFAWKVEEIEVKE